MPSSMIKFAGSVIVAVDDGKLDRVIHHVLHDVSITRQTGVQVIRPAGKGQVGYNELDVSFARKLQRSLVNKIGRQGKIRTRIVAHHDERNPAVSQNDTFPNVEMDTDSECSSGKHFLHFSVRWD